ncbi:hypothetical protein [Kineococcus radiotolerans]|uniref:hypothetical protein n=1 Tax=Kineococcus radiotolerans TaxID=131568 RepID=UPI00059E7F1C|nr:hypothetical protein [Kineococcus radiotolerans]
MTAEVASAQSSTPASADWTAGDLEYDELLASFLSDEEGQPGRLQDADGASSVQEAAEAMSARSIATVVDVVDVVDGVDKGPAIAASGRDMIASDAGEEDAGEEDAPIETGEPQGTPPAVEQRLTTDVQDHAHGGERAGLNGARAHLPTQAVNTAQADEQAEEEAGEQSDPASALAAESLPASRTRARRGRTATTSDSAHQLQQPTGPLFAPSVSEAHEPAPLPPAPVFLWQGATLLPAQVPTPPPTTPAPTAPGATDDLDEPATPVMPAPAGSTDAEAASDTPAASGPSIHPEETQAIVSAASSPASTPAPKGPDTPDTPKTAVPAAQAAGEAVVSAPGREVVAPQASVPGAVIDTATFVQQVRDAELRDAAPVLSPVHAMPDGGWRSAVMKLTLGRVQPPPSARQAERDHEIYRVRTPLDGNRHIVVLAYGTGVGKTLTTGAIGLQFAEHRDDRVAVIDADQTAGNLADRFATPADRFLQDLLDEHQHGAVDSVVELRRYARSAKRLDIYSADHSRSFTAQQHREALELLSKFHDVVITDLGSSGLRDMPEVLQTATDVVVVTGTSMDAVDRSRKVLDRLEDLGHERLAREAVVAMVTRTTKDGTLAKAARNGGVHVETLIGHFQRRCRATVLIPYSARLADGVHVDYETLDADVNEAYLRIAGFLANGFRPTPDRHATPAGSGDNGPAQLPTIRPAAAATAPSVTTKSKYGRGRRKDGQATAPSAFAELPHYQGS